MTESSKNLLVVEDEEHLAAGLKLNFELEGYRVDTAASGREASERLLQSEGYDGIILDIMLPDMDGFELCRRLRGAGNFTPVLMLTARNAAEDRVTGLDVGADDYLAKPFDLSELLARVRSLLRRRGWDNTPGERGRDASVLIFGDARINFDTHEAFCGEESITLTQLEFDLLRYFAENAGRVLSRAELLEKVWMLKNYPNTRTVDNFIVRLRRHFEKDPAKPHFFRSVRGTGYKFVWDGASLS
jgi:two-component system OmpR family response regulator